MQNFKLKLNFVTFVLISCLVSSFIDKYTLTDNTNLEIYLLFINSRFFLLFQNESCMLFVAFFTHLFGNPDLPFIPFRFKIRPTQL